jgi:heme/copper-type cytochrome/quinol oxidase subunit 2
MTPVMTAASLPSSNDFCHEGLPSQGSAASGQDNDHYVNLVTTDMTIIIIISLCLVVLTTVFVWAWARARAETRYMDHVTEDIPSVTSQ